MPIGILLLVAGAVFFYRLGEHAYDAGLLAAGLSIAVWLLTWVVLGWGVLGDLGGQLVLIGAMTGYNMQRSSKE